MALGICWSIGEVRTATAVRKPKSVSGAPLIVIVVIIFGVASYSLEFHGLTPESDGSTAVKTHNNHYQSSNRFPYSVTVAVTSGGTMVVELASSTIAGPSIVVPAARRPRS